MGSTRVGARWVYRSVSGNQTGTSTNTVTSAVAVGSTLQLVYRTEFVGSDTTGNTYRSTGVSNGRCSAAGYVTVDGRNDYQYFINGTALNGWSRTTYDPPLLGMPADLASTRSWRTAGTMRTEQSAGMPITTAYDYSSSVGTVRRVTVPAGTFDAVSITLSTGTASSTSYYAKDVGYVSTGGTGYTYELQSYTP
jgi:hypothetical protein